MRRVVTIPALSTLRFLGVDLRWFLPLEVTIAEHHVNLGEMATALRSVLRGQPGRGKSDLRSPVVIMIEMPKALDDPHHEGGITNQVQVGGRNHF